MARAVSFFNSNKPDKTTAETFGHERKIEPIFLLFCDALQQMVKMNPLAFEYSPSYILFVARELHTNKFWEFVQSEKQTNAKALPTIFAKDLR